MRHDEIRDLFAAADLCLHRQPQIGPVEAMHEHGRRTAKQPLHNIRARGRVGRGGEGHRLHAAERGLHFAELGVFGAEIVAPLRDAMRLVDGQHRDFGALEQIERFGLHEPFRRDVDEAQFAARNALRIVRFSAGSLRELSAAAAMP